MYFIQIEDKSAIQSQFEELAFFASS